MQLAEPMTLMTDYALAALGVWLGLRTWRAAAPGSDPRRTWAAAFWAVAAAAALGGSAHGFAPYLSASAASLLWRATMLAIGLTSGLLLWAAARAVAPRGRRALALLGWAIVAEVAAYGVWVCAVDDDFSAAVLQYGGAMAIVLAIHLVLAARGRRGARWIAGGIVVSFAAAAIQQAGIAPHPRFNHNDLYHVVQMVGLWLLYLGARQAPGNRPPEEYVQ